VKWRDTSVELEGPVVAEFQRLFLRHWVEHGGRPLRDAGFFPALARAGDDVVRVVGSSPEHHPDAFYASLVSAIESAERRVHITQSYFAPPPAELRALARAARRGLDVTLILAGPTDEPLVAAAGQAGYAELLAAGVAILERQGVVLHSKTVVIDGVWSSVGSSNLDYRSVLYNDEADAIVIGTSFGEAMEGMFADDLAHSAPIDPARWRRRGVGERIREWFSGLFEWLM
jgi:cardiolipin synthase